MRQTAYFAIRFLSVLSAVLLISGCDTTSQQTPSVGLQIPSARGAHIDEVIKNWGPPDKEYKLSDGGTVRQWIYKRESATYYGPSYYPGTGVSAFAHWPSSSARLYPGWWAYYPAHGFYPGPFSLVVNRPAIFEYECQVNITSDRSGHVIDQQMSGNACPSAFLGQKETAK